VHHIIRIADGGTNDEENLVALCRRCHNRVTAARSGMGTALGTTDQAVVG
jgi:5-methylcytosine-specific restriction endonuclease McrA